MKRLCGPLILSSLVFLAVFAARPAQKLEQAPADLRVDVRLVNVFATVTDNSGRYVSGLTKDDFVLEEDGIKQEVAHFSQDREIPVSVGIVLDTSGSMQNKLRTA